jgi:regulator of RNase E activity RraA
MSHAFAHIVDFGQPVEIGGLTVASGDVLFGDSGGVLLVPPSIVARVPEAAELIRNKEARIAELCRSPQFSIDGLRTLVRDLG